MPSVFGRHTATSPMSRLRGTGLRATDAGNRMATRAITTTVKASAARASFCGKLESRGMPKTAKRIDTLGGRAALAFIAPAGLMQGQLLKVRKNLAA